jgi:hypothetical protein
MKAADALQQPPEPQAERVLRLALSALLDEAVKVGRAAGVVARKAGEDLSPSGQKPEPHKLLEELRSTLPRYEVGKGEPGVARLEVDAYAIFDHADPERAGPWIDHELDDPNAAYILELYETAEQARAALLLRAERVAREIYPFHSKARLQPIVNDVADQLTVRRVKTREGVQGRDYRFCDCDDLPNALTQIRTGEQTERAWRVILRQRAVNEVDGALLPGPSPAGTLVIFITADGLDISGPL